MNVAEFAQRLTKAVGCVAARLATGPDDIAGLDDDDLLGLLAEATEARKALDVILATGSAEVARRSTRERGYDGLAQRNGVRTGTALVQQITGQSRRDVMDAMLAGQELAPPAAPPEEASVGVAGDDGAERPTWRDELRGALRDGRLSQAQFHAIRGGLGEPPSDRYPDTDPEFYEDAWRRAIGLLLEEAATRSVEDLRDQARIARDRLDPVGVPLRFKERFAARSFRRWTDEGGQHHARIVFDDDAAAWVDGILRAALRPRRGPRFVDAVAPAEADAAARGDAGAQSDVRTHGDGGGRASDADDRTNEQLQYDTIVAILRTGANADPAQAFGDRQPGVRIVVEASAIEQSGDRGEARVVGVGHLEDGGQALPGGVVEKYLCDAGSVGVILHPGGRPLDLGREKRLFSRRQRIAIAVRSGGCVSPGCDRPPSECEYHHLDHWWEHHGRTDVDDGVPLCRNCHLRLHNQGARITRERDPVTGVDTYWLRRPADPRKGVIPAPVQLRTKSPRRFTAGLPATR